MVYPWAIENTAHREEVVSRLDLELEQRVWNQESEIGPKA
jgi:hypothetical protein